MFPRQIGLTSLMLSVVLGTAVLAGIGAGQKVGIDLGPTATDNWNNITGNGTTPAGSVLTLDGTILAGVSITVADGRFFNNDGADNWVGLATNGGAAPPEFVDSVTTDIAGTYGTEVPFRIEIAGLNDALTYDIVAVCTSIPPYANVETVTINDNVSLSVARDDSRENGVFHSFTAVSTDGAGNIELVFTNEPDHNPIVCGILITAVAMGQASSPQPDVEATDVLRDTALTWVPGLYAATHDVYFGTSFDDVNDASRSNPMGVLVSQGQTTASYDPAGVLDFETTYYWRIDEVNAAPDNTIFKGEIWSFTTEPFAYAIATVTATSNGISDQGAGPENTVDGSGLDEVDLHSVDSADMWVAKASDDEDLYIQYEFDRIYKLHEMLVWNYNVQFELMLGFGVKDVTIEYSENGQEWVGLGDVELNQATATSTYTHNTAVDLQGVAARFVRLTVNSAFGTTGQYGLSEVRFMYIPAHVREPRPADGAMDVTVDSTLAWRAGRDAVSHEIYFGTDSDALELVATTDVANYDPGTLNLGATYYWQANAVQETESWAGDLWSFATQAYLVVDDFESYTDDIDAGEAIFDTWLDGWVNDTGSTVGHMTSPFAEQNIVRSGSQSMPLFYDNATAAVSEAEFALDQDWTANGIQSLTLHFYGDPDNTGQLYAKINGTKVSYDGDGDDITRPVWQPWNIDLSAIGNVSSVRSLTIGIEGAGTTGVVYIDDIRLYPQAPEFIVPAEPTTANLVGRYAFEGNASDGSGNGFHGTVHGNVTYREGIIGSAADFDGIDSLIDCGDVPVGTVGAISVSLWVHPRNINQDWAGYASKWTLDNSQCTFWLGQHSTDGWLRFSVYPGGPTAETAVDSGRAILRDGEWTHVVCTYDGDIQKIYADGVEIVASPARDAALIDRGGNLRLGIVATANFFDGLMDDVRIYDRALTAEETAWLAGRRAPMHKSF
ncbi:MAG: discoidin domain-containing protein [Planctomycetota bacterium]|nr:discoidin domain-containing protein [Planctomycetota bacterium]